MASIACTPPVPAPDDAVGLRERARGALLGLAVGDALGAPAENLKPSEIRARWGRVTGYVAEVPSGTDDTEYAIFSGLLLARHGSALTPAHVEAAWHEWIADRAEGPFRGAGFSERGTLENLRRGLAAPISAQHRHAWSDGLAMRAAPFGVFAAGRPAEAARLVAIDGSVSHEGEGIYGGQAVAAGVAAAMAGAPVPVVIASALAVIPEDSWTARSLRRAVAVAHRGERAVRSAVVIGGYPWTDLAPEAVALSFGAYAAADGDFREAVLTAVNMGRDADTTAALAGALSGATHGISAIPPTWSAAIGPARGRCLPSMAGHHILDVAELLVPGEGGKWGVRVVLPGVLPGVVRDGARGEAAQGVPGEVTKALRGEVTAAAPEGVPVELRDAAAEGVPVELRDAAPDEARQAAPADVRRAVRVETTEAAPAEAREASPDKVLEAVSGEVTEAAPAEAQRAVPVGVPELMPGDATKAVPAEGQEAAPGQATKAAPAQARQVVPGEAAEAVPADARRAVPGETTEAAPAEAREASPDKVLEAVSGEVTEAAPAEAQRAVPVGVPELMPGETTEAVPTEGQEAAPGQATKAAPAQARQVVPGEAAEAVPADARRAVPGETTEAAPAEAREASPDKVLEAVSGEVTEAAPAEAQRAVPVGVPELMPGETTEAVPTEGQEAAPGQATKAAPGQATGAAPVEVGGRGVRGRSPLVEVGKAGHPDSEVQS